MFVGPSIPHSDDITKSEQRALLVLLLFKPWRTFQDLKGESENLSVALKEFQSACGIFETSSSR